MLLERADRAVYNLRAYSWLIDWSARARRAARATIDRPIFLLGLQGGGLTLLSRMLRRHPCFVSAAGDSSYWTSADEIQNVFGLVLPPQLTGLRYKAPAHPRLPPPRSWTYATDELLPAYRGRAADASPQLKTSLEAVIRYCLERFGAGRPGTRFIDKSQSYTVRVGLLKALLGEYGPRFILVMRDPYVSVHRAALGKAGDMRRLKDRLSWKERVELCTQHYFNSVRCALEDGCRDIVRFEDLLRDPEATLRRVCALVEVDFRADMLPSADDRLPLGSRFHERWFPLKPDINREYEGQLGEGVARSVNARGGELVRLLGYPVIES